MAQKSEPKYTEIMALTADGLTAKEVGAELGYSKQTVEKYLQHLKEFYEAKNITHLIVIAIKKEIIKIK